MVETDPIFAESLTAIHQALLGGDIVLVDVREPTEHGVERIRGALLYPLSTFDPNMLPQGGRAVVLHCGSGKRSAAASLKCKAADVAVRSHMDGGIGAWKSAHLPILSVDPATGAVQDRI